MLEGIALNSQIGLRPAVRDSLYPGNFPDKFAIAFAYQLRSHVANSEPAVSFHTIFCDIAEFSGPIVPHAVQLTWLLAKIEEERQSYTANSGSTGSS